MTIESAAECRDAEQARNGHLRSKEEPVERAEGAKAARMLRDGAHLSPDVAKDAFEVGVERADLEQACTSFAGDRRERMRKRAGVVRVELERVLAVESHADGGPALE